MALIRAATIALALGVLASCGGTGTTDPNARPRSPNELPRESASLQFSGPFQASITEVRVLSCSSRKAGDFASFYASIYFSAHSQWYYLEVIGANPLPATASTGGYAGPGIYSATADFREMIVSAGGITSGSRAWGVPIGETATLTVSPGKKSISVGSASSSWQPRQTTSTLLDLWPSSPDSSGQVPGPTPNADQVEHVSGSWTCS
jgi:hypothetical protein